MSTLAWHVTYSPTSMFVVPRGAAAGVSVLVSRDFFDELSSVKEYVASTEETVTHGDPREYEIPVHESTGIPRAFQESGDPKCNGTARVICRSMPDVSEPASALSETMPI